LAVAVPINMLLPVFPIVFVIVVADPIIVFVVVMIGVAFLFYLRWVASGLRD
jgi:hypothetical protein